MAKLTKFELAELARVGIDPRDHEAAEEHLAWLSEKLEAVRAPLDDEGYIDALDVQAGAA
jgi:hypothetical protein